MPLTEQFERQGNWLFRWRSFLPVIYIPLIIAAIPEEYWPLGSWQLHEFWEFTCLAISFLGLAVRCAVIGYAPEGTSGRNTREQIAESLNTTGLYSLVRHPLYFGNFLIGLGAVMVPLVWWLPTIYILGFWLYYERIMYAEEAFLRSKFGDAVAEWAKSTPAFWPKLRGWVRPERSFSFRNVLRREYTGLMLVILLHFGLEEAEHLTIHGYQVELFWWLLLGVGTVMYLTLRSLKKHTVWLNVAGR